MAATTRLTIFGKYLRALRKKHRLTLKQVGEMTDKHLADVQKIETGMRLPDYKFCIDLVNGLGKIGIAIALNDVLRQADLEPIESGVGAGGRPLQSDVVPSGESNANIDRRQWLIQQIRTALTDPDLDDETFEALSGAIIALRKELEKSASAKRHGSNRGNEPQRRAAGRTAHHYPAAT